MSACFAAAFKLNHKRSAHGHVLYRVHYTHSTTTNPVIKQDLTCTRILSNDKSSKRINIHRAYIETYNV